MKLGELVAELRTLLEAPRVPVGGTSIRKGSPWKKDAPAHWTLLNKLHQPGVQVARHPRTQPIPQSWERAQRFNR